MIEWQWEAFHKLDAATVYEIMKARQAVFVLEQQCLFADMDGADQRAWHLMGWDEHHRLQAYMRCFAPGEHYEEAALGRVLTMRSARRKGLGKSLMSEGIRRIEQNFPDSRIRISAQQQYERYYAGFDFVRVSKNAYLEAGILHIEMLR